MKERKASRGCRKRFRVCHQKKKRSSARQRSRSLPQNKKRNSDSAIGNCQLLRCSVSAILQKTLLILTKLMEIVFLTAAWSQEPQSSSKCISDAEGDGSLAGPDERTRRTGSLPEEALHTELNVNNAVAKVELEGRKASKPVSSNAEPPLRQHSNEGPDEELQSSQGHADFGIPTPDCEESF